MAKKPSPKELKQQGEELSKDFAAIRKRQHNFAMQIGKDGLVFHIDKKKPADVLWRNAKKDGGGPKGAQGRVTMSGKILELDCDDPDSAPKNLLKLAKKHFAERGQPVRLVIKGVEEEDDDDAAEEAAAKETTKRDRKEEPVEEAKEKPAPAPEPQEEAAAPSDPEEENAPEAAPTDGLREVLEKEFSELAETIEAAENSENKGLAKKVAGLKKMFVTQIAENPKKAGSVLTLMNKTLETAENAGDFTVSAGGNAAPSDTERENRIEALEASIDAMLDELAA